MVSTEYPPMRGGVGRFTYNLVRSLRANNLEVKVVCDVHGMGDFGGLSPSNKQNSELLLNIVRNYKPDIVHIQHEHGLYGFYLNPLFPPKTSTGLDKFYDNCKTPIVTTFHTSMNFIPWMQLVNTKSGNSDKDIVKMRVFYKYWKQLINYVSLHRINKEIMSKSAYGIVFSNHMRSLIPGTNVVYHGSEPWSTTVKLSQKEARMILGLPQHGRLALAQGFFTSTKGWDIMKRMKMPDNWKLVVNYSKNHYNKEDTDIDLKNKVDNKIINLNKQYLSEEQLSMLFFSCDAVFLPYKVSSGSGVMFDGIGHGKPFIASDLDFFKEFSDLNLGVVSKRNFHAFEKAFVKLEKEYRNLETGVMEFRNQIKWDAIARQHYMIYENVIEKQKISMKVA